MKKVLSAIVLTGLLAMPAVSLALEEIPEDIITEPQDLVDLIGTIGNWIFTILLAVAVIMLVIAGFYFVTAGGNPDSVAKARQMLINALIGVAIALAAKGLVELIKGLVSSTD